MDWNQFQYNPAPRGVYPVDTRAWRHRGASFDPRGELVAVGDAAKFTRHRNPVTEDPIEASQYAARIFVGLSVGREVGGKFVVEPKYSVEDVVRIVQRVRTFQTGNPAASFLMQRGIFKYGPGEFPAEDSVQVIIFAEGADEQLSAVLFKDNIAELIQVLVDELEQQVVFAELQAGGVPRMTLTAKP